MDPRLGGRRQRVCLIAAAILLLVPPLTAKTRADRIVVEKSTRRMTLYARGKVLKSYLIALGGSPVGAKTRQGDHRTPEGIYRIEAKNSRSRFHLSLRVSYPNARDRERARKMGVNPGGDIMIHGLPDQYAFVGPLHRQTDWTDGCIAVTNEEIEEIWNLVPIGAEIEIRP